MISIVYGNDGTRDRELLESMFRLRHAVFIDRLGWDLPCEPGRESDQFDGEEAVYIIIRNPWSGEAVASCRLLPTTSPNLLCDLFPFLEANGTPPRDPRIWEASRLAVDHRREKLSGCGNVCGTLLSGIMEFALRAGLTHLVSVSDIRVERILRASGWQLTRLGEPHHMEGFAVMGEITEVSATALARIRRRCGVARMVVPVGEDTRRVA